MTGSPIKNRYFTGADYFTKLLRTHFHITDTKNIVANGLKSNRLKTERAYKNDYSLGGAKGVPLYIHDYSTLATGGLTGNLAVTYLGYYGLSYTITSVDIVHKTATVHFTVTNSSTIRSATHPAVIGYTEWWKNNIGNPLDQQFSSGPLTQTTQTFNWNEVVSWK